jgi:hypothetical protein
MFFPEDFLTLADDLLKSATLNKNEALFRSIISRAYYSAFLSAREKIDSLYPMALYHPKHDMHQQIVDFLGKGKIYFEDESLSSDLLELRTFRVDADYHFPNACKSYEKKIRAGTSPDSLQTAQNCYDMAEDIINRVNALE